MSITDDVKGADYYHGLIPRTDIEPLLKKEGDFLLRKTELTPGNLFLPFHSTADTKALI